MHALAVTVALAALLLPGCVGDDTSSDDDDDGVIDTGDPRPDEDTLDCDELVLDIDGPAEPSVGDEWTLWMRCDGATMTGTMVLRFDPADIAEVESNHAVFVAPGDALMRFQVGNRRIEQDITVAP